MKLIRLSEYVESLQNSDATNRIYDKIESDDLTDVGDEKYSMIVKYKDFLKQLLNLPMFMPCREADGKWAVLEMPLVIDYKTEEGNIIDEYYHDLKEYQQAKERVLFEGFTFRKHVNSEYVAIDLKGSNRTIGFNIDKSYLNSLGGEALYVVEELIINYPFKDLELTLTLSAIKQLGL